MNSWLRELWKFMCEIFLLLLYLKDFIEVEFLSVLLFVCRFVVEEVVCVEGIVEASGERLMEVYMVLRFVFVVVDVSDVSILFLKVEYEVCELCDIMYYDGFVSENRCLTSDDVVKEVRYLEF